MDLEPDVNLTEEIVLQGISNLKGMYDICEDVSDYAVIADEIRKLIFSAYKLEGKVFSELMELIDHVREHIDLWDVLGADFAPCEFSDEEIERLNSKLYFLEAYLSRCSFKGLIVDTDNGDSPEAGDESLESGFGCGTFPRRELFLNLLLDLGIDLTQCSFIEGTDPNNLEFRIMRKAPYVIYVIPELNRSVFVCDEADNATFVVDTVDPEVLEFLAPMKKSELRQLCACVYWSSDRGVWEERMLRRLNEDLVCGDNKEVDSDYDDAGDAGRAELVDVKLDSDTGIGTYVDENGENVEVVYLGDYHTFLFGGGIINISSYSHFSFCVSRNVSSLFRTKLSRRSISVDVYRKSDVDDVCKNSGWLLGDDVVRRDDAGNLILSFNGNPRMLVEIDGELVEVMSLNAAITERGLQTQRYNCACILKGEGVESVPGVLLDTKGHICTVYRVSELCVLDPFELDNGVGIYKTKDGGNKEVVHLPEYCSVLDVSAGHMSRMVRRAGVQRVHVNCGTGHRKFYLKSEVDAVWKEYLGPEVDPCTGFVLLDDGPEDDNVVFSSFYWKHLGLDVTLVHFSRVIHDALTPYLKEEDGKLWFRDGAGRKFLRSAVYLQSEVDKICRDNGWLT